MGLDVTFGEILSSMAIENLENVCLTNYQTYEKAKKNF
jgi:hypothetical protein